MPLLLPTALLGDNLGQRHRHLNALVNQAAAGDKVSFQDIEALEERSVVDRLFKIDLANKLKNLEFVLKTLKDDDILYVSRALKSNWLLERRDVINPKYLEHVLFPEMVMPAISRMKHWLYINLKDPAMCEEFYKYYKNEKIGFATKFLNYCSNEFVLDEFPNILIHVTPHLLKVLGEKCPKIVKVYFDALERDNDLVIRYLKEEKLFYKSIKCLLKLDPDTFLDITERYYCITSFGKFSPLATEYILQHHKGRFMAKSELYIVYLLHMSTVAQRLSVEECQEVVIKLARADYLKNWFTYEKVEPLVKRVSRLERAYFKEKVFVEKNVGEREVEWPYSLPASPKLAATDPDEAHVFHDQDFEPIQMNQYPGFRHRMNKRSCAGLAYCAAYRSDCIMEVKSELQKLFDEFRFVGFEGTLQELRGRISASSSADRRRDMLLVLVSKTGGRTESLRTLLELALQLRNEPVHERAAIVRSLVKRANVWRVPQDIWDSMLEYGRGLGLDGKDPEAECIEGLHAVVLRQILATGKCEPAVLLSFLNHFSTFDKYKLTSTERPPIATGLQSLLRTAADANPEFAAKYLNYLLDVLDKYHVSFQSAVPDVLKLAERDAKAAKSLLMRLYRARVGRRELLRQYLDFRHDDAALVNVLRHDPDALKSEWLVKLLIDRETRGNQFFLKIAIYFNESGGIAEQVLRALKDNITVAPDVLLARPMATLVGQDMETIWRDQDVEGNKRYKLSAALRANMHRARPAPDALALGWRKAGMKAVAWRAMRCRPSQVTALVNTFLQERNKRTVRLVLVLAQRTMCAADIFATATSIRPLAALRAALPYYRSLGEAADPRVWDIVKPSILNVDLTNREGLRHILKKVKCVPNAMKPEYCTLMYLVLDKISDWYANDLCRDMMGYLPQLSDDLLKSVLLRMLAKVEGENPVVFPAIVIRYLMLSKSDDEEKVRFEEIGEPFLKKLDTFREAQGKMKNQLVNYNQQIMASLLYNAVFFDLKYNCCLGVMERVLTWISSFLPKETHFKQYINIHATMLYFKAIRQSMKLKPEIFADPAKKMSEGVEVVGSIFGRYIAKEVSQLKSQYFESVIEIYSQVFADYLTEYFMYSSSRSKFIAAVTRGILTEGLESEARMAAHIFHSCRYNLETSEAEKLLALLMKSEAKEVHYFVHAENYV